jgi:tRNA(fMet)-specific endonuclease VapC
MTALYMLDTDTCIFLARRSSPDLEARIQSVPLQQQAMSVITYAELLYGVQLSAARSRKQNLAAVEQLARHLAVLDWPSDAAQHYAQLRADLKKRGAMLGANDLLIAAHARALGATVVTNNVKDFGRVKGLLVENWMG